MAPGFVALGFASFLLMRRRAGAGSLGCSGGSQEHYHGSILMTYTAKYMDNTVALLIWMSSALEYGGKSEQFRSGGGLPCLACLMKTFSLAA